MTLFGATNESLCDEFSKLMQKEFEMSIMGELSHFLGLQIKQLKDDIFINQSKYINDMLKKYGMKSVKSAATPMNTTTKLTTDEQGKGVEEKLYRGMIGCLLYLTTSRHNIMFSVYLFTCFQSCPKDFHLSVVKRIFKYLSSFKNVSL